MGMPAMFLELIFLGLDRFDQHYQASVPFPQTSAVAKSHQHQDHDE